MKRILVAFALIMVHALITPLASGQVGTSGC